ncbi:hypothetical protein MVEN_00474100 [Mycena venus]|uniref:Uncharacterized protein n=1 Tax=Mycena venus TaxID=2733690 RepID=A0A8H7DAV2_9AGAR|nr:hypothetical protein MVEN_00474100 [Mycena venus]
MNSSWISSNIRRSPPDALYFLALLSRRLHFIALPIYFARNGIDLETKTATIELETDRLDPLSALKICLFLSSMDHISCVFPHPSCYSIVLVLAQMKRFQTFILRLAYVKTVTLYLDPHHLRARRCLSTGRCLSVTTDEALKEWACQYGALLNCIVQKGCKSLTAINGGQVTEAYELQPLGFSEKYLPSVALHLFPSQNAQMLGFRRDPTQGTVDIRLPPVPSSGLSMLTSLHIHSPTLLVPPGLDWMISALRHSPITSLTICMSSTAVDSRFWGTILALVASAAPNLTAVALTEIDLRNEHDALEFIARLPRLTDLDLAHVRPLLDTCTPHADGSHLPLEASSQLPRSPHRH